MKKELLLIAVFLGMSGLLYAASLPIANGPSVLTKAVINATPPSYSGQPVVCSDCTNANTGKYNLCLSTGTGVGAWILISSAAAVTVCQ